MGSIWHVGIAVPGLEKGKKELGEVFGLRWRPARVRKLTLADAAGTMPLLNRGPAGTLIELCDLHSDRPSLRDLFPPGSEFAGEPLLGSALRHRGREHRPQAA